MKYGIGVLAVLGFGFMAAAMASAQGPGRPDGDRGRPGGPNREEILKRFDADGDGQLSPEEKQKAKEAMMRRRGGPGQGPGQGGPGGPGQRHFGPEGPGREGHQPGQLLMEAFKRSDRDGDRKLAPEEFRLAIQMIMRHIVGGGPGQGGPGGPGRPGGPGFGGPGGQGPGGPGFGGPGGPGGRFDRPQHGPRDFDRPGHSRGPGRRDVDRPRPDRSDVDRPRRDRPHRPDAERPVDPDRKDAPAD